LEWDEKVKLIVSRCAQLGSWLTRHKAVSDFVEDRATTPFIEDVLIEHAHAHYLKLFVVTITAADEGIYELRFPS